MNAIIKNSASKVSCRVSFLNQNNLSQAEIYLYVTLGLFLSYLIGELDLRSAFSSLSALNFIILFAWYVAIKKILGDEIKSDASIKDILFGLGLLLLNTIFTLIWNKFFIGLVTFILGYFIFQKTKSKQYLRAAAIVLLAISGNTFFSPIFYQLTLPELIHADAFLLGNLLKVIRPDILWSGAVFQLPDGRAISLVGGCSSFQNISLALVAYIAIAIHMRNFLVRKDFYAIVIIGFLMIFLNDIRLVLCAWSLESYLYWHDGYGATIYQNVANLAIVIAAILGVKIATPDK